MMENKIVEDFKNLQVFAAYDFFKMDEFVQDLTGALEETTRSKGKNKVNDTSRKPKRKSKKRKSHISPLLAFELGNMTEASESSLDEAIKDYMANIARQSDSDDILARTQHLPALTSINPNGLISLVESDSVNENFSPMQPHRRKRRFKRMSIDQDNAHAVEVLLNESQKTGVLCENETEFVIPSSSASGAQSGPSTSSPRVQAGKRKRSIKERLGNSFDLDSIADDASSCNGGEASSSLTTNSSACMTESSASSVSSNESDGLHSNEDGRDGDDEQSDFFHEPGPACGIPGIAWWENSHPQGSPEGSTDPTFESILKGSFDHMSSTARRNFQTRLKMMAKPGRKYRSGRRLLKDASVYSLSCFLQDRQQWTDHIRKLAACRTASAASAGSNAKAYDPKRRRNGPHCSQPEECEIGGNAEAIQESNVGHRILQHMGWNPGMGLGVDGQGMVNPVVAMKRPRRQGLGSSLQSTTSNSNN